MSSPNLEGLEIKEATPSIAPSIYESLQYTRKWRIILAVGIGCSLIGVCILAFYLSAKARTPKSDNKWIGNNRSTEEPIIEPSWQWRTLDNNECFITSKLSAACPKDFGGNVTLLIAFGGLRPSQVSVVDALSEFVRCGVSASHLVPTYPTSTYTNLYSIATGLYAESHGIISDEMYDPVMDMNFTIGTPSSHKSEWWGGEPIWNTAKKKGIQSATYLWAGSDVRIQNRYPSYWQKDEKPFMDRIAKVLDWISLPKKERPEIIMMYYDGPSQAAQQNGIFSDTIDNVLRDIGLGLDELIAGLEREGLASCVNIVVVSDHGIAPSHCEESIFLDDILAATNVVRVFTGPVGRLMFKNKEDEDQVNNRLQCQDKRMRVLTKKRVPKRYHYTNNKRIGSLVLDTKVGSRVTLENDFLCLEGDFGYNNLEHSMQGVFIAHGPAFKNGYQIESFRNVEIYNLICLLLDIDPAPNNGTRNSLANLLKDGTFNKTAIIAKEEFLVENYKARPLRKKSAVLGIRGIDEITEENCQCDPVKTLVTAVNSKVLNSSMLPISELPSLVSKTKTQHQPISSTKVLVETIFQKDNKATTPTTIKTESILFTGTTVLTSTVNIQSVDQENRSTIISSTKQSSVDVEILKRSNRSLHNLIKLPRLKRTLGVKNDSVQFTKTLLELHAPWGNPRYSAPEIKSDHLYILPHTSYTIGFPESLNLPVWSSFTLTRKKLEEVQTYMPTVPEGIKVDENNLKHQVPLGCWMADSRLNRSNNDQCSRSLQNNLYNAQNISLRQLFPEELELPGELSTEGFLLSNLSPLRQGYENGGRNAIISTLKKLTLKFGAINVVHGPVFDYDFDGRRDSTTVIRDTIKPIVASDFFYIVSLCNETRDNSGKDEIVDEVNGLKLCPLQDLKTYSFILPNTDIEDDCLMTMKEYLLYHLASVWDVQTLTGITFYKNLPEEDFMRRLIHQPITFPFDNKEDNI